MRTRADLCGGSGLDDSSAVECDLGPTLGIEVDLVPVGMNLVVVFGAEEYSVLQTCSATLRPVFYVMCFGPSRRFRATSEDAALVAQFQCPPKVKRKGPLIAAYIEDVALGADHDSVNIAVTGEALRSLCRQQFRTGSITDSDGGDAVGEQRIEAVATRLGGIGFGQENARIYWSGARLLQVLQSNYECD